MDPAKPHARTPTDGSSFGDFEPEAARIPIQPGSTRPHIRFLEHTCIPVNALTEEMWVASASCKNNPAIELRFANEACTWCASTRDSQIRLHVKAHVSLLFYICMHGCEAMCLIQFFRLPRFSRRFVYARVRVGAC